MARKHKKPQIVEHVASDDDEEIDEDEAFNSDDERKYGSFFRKNEDVDNDDEEDVSDSASDDEEGSELGSDDEDEQGDGGQYMLDLLNNIDKNNNDEPKKETSNITHYVKEDPFSSAVIQGSKLTLDALVDEIKDTSEFGAVQKKLKGIMGKKATSTPTARVISERAQRRVNYIQQSKDMSSWIDAVQENRQAETLDFRPHLENANKVTAEGIVDTFVPTTDFERQMHEALKAAGQEDEAALIRAEEQAIDALGENEITLEEYKKRRGQLAKMRALMFYEEQKRHHINKIKSKKYRRIRKKQRERQKEAEMQADMAENPEMERELQEKEEMERMKERMTLAHKNTSKWAKHILKRGKNVDVDTRRALSAQLKRGDDLLRKMKTTRDGNESDDSDDDLVASARKVLEDTEDDNGDGGAQSGLFKLAFMQRGLQRERERARQEARELLMELEENEQLERDDRQDAPGDNVDVEEEKASAKKKRIASKAEMSKVLKEGSLIASSLQFGNTTATAVESNFSIDVGSSASQFTKNISSVDNSSSETVSTPPAKKQKNVNTTTMAQSYENEIEENPWLMSEKKDDGGAKKIAKSSTKVSINVESAVDLIPEIRKDNGRSNIVTESKTNDQKESTDSAQKTITMLSQEELVRRAFAGPSAAEAEEEFAREKEEFEEMEDPDNKKRKKNENKKDLSSSGWGSWTGKGAPPPKLPKKLPKKLQPPPKLPERQRQDAAKPRVILSERRVKRLADSCMIADIPYPYKTREEYERAMAGGVGREWNVTNSFKDMTRPDILTRPGQVIQPISKRMKQSRAPAKF